MVSPLKKSCALALAQKHKTRRTEECGEDPGDDGDCETEPPECPADGRDLEADDDEWESEDGD